MFFLVLISLKAITTAIQVCPTRRLPRVIGDPDGGGDVEISVILAQSDLAGKTILTVAGSSTV